MCMFTDLFNAETLFPWNKLLCWEYTMSESEWVTKLNQVLDNYIDEIIINILLVYGTN